MRLFMGTVPGKGAPKITSEPELEIREITLIMQVQKLFEANQRHIRVAVEDIVIVTWNFGVSEIGHDEVSPALFCKASKAFNIIRRRSKCQ